MKKTVRVLRILRALSVSVPLTTLTSIAMAQQTVLPGQRIPEEAKKATLEVSESGELTLNGKPARLSAAAQIRGTNHLIVLSQSLRGKYPVRVLVDNGGLIHRAWIMEDK